MCWGEAEQKYETCGRGKTLGGQRLGRSCPCSPFNRDHHHRVDHSDGF